MKKFFLLICFLLLMVLTGCQKDVYLENNNETGAENIDSKLESNANENTFEIVKSSKGLRSISLAIPKGWEYSISKSAEQSSEAFGISFWPEGEKEGKICLWYYSAWGVCGTGLEEVEITLGDYSALQGTYDNKKVWDFICFSVSDTKGYYVALNEGAEVWWKEYGADAMKILATIQITEGASVEYLD